MNPEAKGDNHAPFSVKGFYGYSRKRKQVEQKLELKSQKFAQEYIPKKYFTRLFAPSDIWKVFYKQADAFAFVHKARLNLHVFAFESESYKTDHPGLRMYLAVTYPVFWHYYSQLHDTHRHHYEIIPEGSVCKLYFDLEFYREYNQSIEDGYELCRIFIKYVCAWLKEIFSLDCDERHILILDASTATKYSEHLIFLLPNSAFKDNYQVGSFVQFISTQLVMWLKEGTTSTEKENQMTHNSVNESSDKSESGTSNQRKADAKVLCESDMESSERNLLKSKAEKIFSLFSKEMLQKLIVKDKNDEETLICDLGVYTKNRNFRLFQSQKLGQKNPLLLSAHNKFVSVADSVKDRSIFMDSLIANIENSTNLKILIFEQEKQNKTKLRMRNLQIKNTDFSGQEGSSSDMSPYPEVDVFISSLVGSNGRRGKIRHWFYFMEGNLLCYDIVGYRWCGNINREHKSNNIRNINREHKSNNIRLFVDLKKCAYYQKCHDPVCKQANFCSEYYDLPPNVLPWLSQLTTNEDSDLEDSFLAFAAENIEQNLWNSGMEDDDDDILISAAEELEFKKNPKKT